MKIYEKLLKIQIGLKAPKNQYNLFGKYHYRSCEDIQEGIKPLLNETKVTLIIGDELVLIGTHYYIKATARLIDCEDGEVIENTAYAREEESKKGMDVSQVTGSTSSYARKYALNGLFCIDDVKDADTSDNKQDPKKMLDQFESEIRRTGKSLKYFLNIHSVTRASDMTIEALSDSIDVLRNYPSKG